VSLYDLTSGYVEGAAEKNPKTRRGHSPDRRPDCEQMAIGLIVNSEDFPFGYETFDGNRADVPTMGLALQGLQRVIAAGRLKDRNKMERTPEKLQARHSRVNDLFEVALRDAPEGVRLVWEMTQEPKTWRDLQEGAYMLRTNLRAASVERLWSKYMQLTEAEAAFRTLKSGLSIRPLLHGTEVASSPARRQPAGTSQPLSKM